MYRSAAAIAHVLAPRNGAGQAGDRGCALGVQTIKGVLGANFRRFYRRVEAATG